MHGYKETFETWNKVAALYQEKFMDLDIYDASYNYFCSQVPQENAALLDIGCGPGNISRYLLSKRPDYKLSGIDFAPNMVELAQRNNPTANFSVLDCRHIKQLGEMYDGVICGFCAPYLSSPELSKLVADAAAILTEIKPEMKITQEFRQQEFQNFNTTDDHLMHIVGKMKDQKGNIYYKVKNSWGAENARVAHGGYVYMSVPYLRLKAISVLVHKDALMAKTKKSLAL